MRNINPSENVQRHIRDVRSALEKINYDQSEKYLFYLLSYIDEGTFFTILRTIPGQAYDHLATTIYVPSGLGISREQMAEIVKHTTRTISNPAVSADDLNALHEIFAREYPLNPEQGMCVASEGREYAFANYGDDSGRRLEDFFGAALYQPEFLKYAGVLLIDELLGVSCAAEDINGLELSHTVRLLPPNSSPDGFTPHIYHHKFNRPFMVPLGGEVEIIWRRTGFEDRRQRLSVERDGQRVDAPSISDAKKAITPSSFFITSHASKTPVEGAVIVVNGLEIKGQVNFTLAELKNAEVNITAAGYFPFHATLDLAATTQALVQLAEQRKVYRFELPVKSSELGAPIHFELHTKRDIAESPIEGYSLREDDIKEGQGRVNYLDYTGATTGFSMKWLALTGVGALIVGFLLGWLCMGSSPEKAPQDELLIHAAEEVVAPVENKTDQPKEIAKEAVKEPETAQKEPEKAVESPKPEEEKVKSVEKEQPKAQQFTIYKVKSGDNLSKLSKKFKVSIDAIKEANGLTGDGISAGQELKIPKKK